MQFEFAVGREKTGAAARRTSANHVFLDEDDVEPFLRNSAAALTPLKPPPTISTSHLMSFVSGGQYVCFLTIRVVIHQF